MSLYKYVAAERIDVLKHGYIRFSQSSALNDPIEVSPVFRDVSNVLPLIADERYAGVQIKIESTIRGEPRPPFIVMLGKGDEERKRCESFMADHVKEIALAFGESIGVLSLTTESNNLLMWAHYAQQHQGFVIEFDEAHRFFRQGSEDQIVGGGIFEVTYLNERPCRVNMVEVTTQELFFTKGKDWEYEREWRLLRLLSDSEMSISTSAGAVHLFATRLHLGVILGCRISEQHRGGIEALLSRDERFQHVTLYQAFVDPEKYRLNIYPAEVGQNLRK